MAYDNVKWPFGKASTLSPDYAATIAVDIRNTKTFVNIALTGDATLNITPDAELEAGAEVILVVSATTNGFDLTLGNAIDGANIVGVAGKTNVQNFYYDGTKFIAVGTYAQIN